MTGPSRLAIAAALLAAACTQGPTTVGLRLERPSAIAAFSGLTEAPKLGPDGKPTNLRPLLAVASERGDELRLLDPQSDVPVFGPGVVFPLSIPTDPRPRLLAAASLGDGMSDLLVVVATGAATVQVIDTWSGVMRAVPLRVATGRDDLPLDGPDLLGPGAEIVSAIAVPKPNGVAGTARLILGATGAGGRLVVLDFVRADVATGAIGLAAPADKPAGTVSVLGFLPGSLALGPGPIDPATQATSTKLYVASPDPILGGVKGVAQLDPLADASAPWAPEAVLDARAGTVLVAAALVDELAVSSDPCRTARYGGVQQPRVYAALAQADCGPSHEIDCGLVTLDPATRALAPDPAAALPLGLVPFQDARAPMPIPGLPLQLAIVTPPASTGGRLVGLDANVPSASCQASGSPTSPLMRITPQAGVQNTSALAVVASTDGRVYWYDLSRWAPVNDLLSPVAGTRVLSATSTPVTANTWSIGLRDAPSNAPTVDPVLLREDIALWPGFVDGATWSLSWQGVLPSLARQSGIVVADAAGNVYAALQSEAAPAAGASVASIADPALGVLPGDVLELTDLGCGDGRIAAVVDAAAPSPVAGVTFPGGALQLDVKPSCTPAVVTASPGVPFPTTLTVRAQKLLLTSSTKGYLGRPEFGKPFTLGWRRPADVQAAVTDPRQQAVELAVNRKLRRLYYPNDYPCPIPGSSTATATVGCYPGFPDLSDPLVPGPALRFQPEGYFVPQPNPAGDPAPPRDAVIVFGTTSGLSISARHPSSGGALAAGIAVVDPSTLVTPVEVEQRVYVPYADDLVLRFTPAETPTQVQTLR